MARGQPPLLLHSQGGWQVVDVSLHTPFVQVWPKPHWKLHLRGWRWAGGSA